MLHNDCRTNSCIEHATGIMEEEKAPENLSKRMSSVSLSANDKKVCLQVLVFFCMFYAGQKWNSIIYICSQKNYWNRNIYNVIFHA